MIYTKADLKKESSKKLWLGIAIGGCVSAVLVTGALLVKRYAPIFREYRELKRWKEEQERIDLMNRFGTSAPHSTIFDKIKRGISHSLSDDDIFDEELDADFFEDYEADEDIGEASAEESETV